MVYPYSGGNLPWQRIDTGGVFVTVSAVAEKSTDKRQRHTDAKPQATHQQHGREGQGRGTAVAPDEQVDDEKTRKDKPGETKRR